MRDGLGVTVGALVAVALGVGGLAGQELADYDYENLSFRGLGVEPGIIFPNRLESTVSYNVRFDLGFLGPGFRLTPSISFWRSNFKTEEVAELEGRLEELIVQSDPAASPEVDLGSLEWTDLVLMVDGQYVWPMSSRVESFLGTGFGIHIMNGEGDAIRDTFVEDLLDRLTLGLNGHGGVALIVSPQFRFSGQLRYEVLDDLSYPELRLGGIFTFGGGT